MSKPINFGIATNGRPRGGPSLVCEGGTCVLARMRAAALSSLARARAARGGSRVLLGRCRERGGEEHHEWRDDAEA